MVGRATGKKRGANDLILLRGVAEKKEGETFQPSVETRKSWRGGLKKCDVVFNF
jgi:hypothetical protein